MGTDSSDNRAKIWFSGYYKCQKSPKNRSSPSDVGLECSDGGYSPLALPWRHPCSIYYSIGGNCFSVKSTCNRIVLYDIRKLLKESKPTPILINASYSNIAVKCCIRCIACFSDFLKEQSGKRSTLGSYS